MFRLGEKQTLKVVKKVNFGIYLSQIMGSHVMGSPAMDNKEERVLLPIRQVPEGIDIGDELEVFLYRDSEDRVIATTKEPKLQMGQVAALTVVQVGSIGAFLDWGLDKDLFLPFKQQTRRVCKGESVLVSLYLDKSSRLCATMNVYQNLRTDSPYQKDDQVEGVVYEISRNFGAFVAVDEKFSALIPSKELYGKVEVGDRVHARVTQVHEDGKLDLSIREKAYLQIQTDAEEILRLIDSFDGVLPFNDKASPEVIKRETGMSKNEFKRAVGNLLKAGKIAITDKSIRRL